jgi:hypothetical protein
MDEMKRNSVMAAVMAGMMFGLVACGGGGGNGITSETFGPDTLVVELTFDDGPAFGSVSEVGDIASASVTFRLGNVGQDSEGDYRLTFVREFGADDTFWLQRYSTGVGGFTASGVSQTGLSGDLSGDRLRWQLAHAENGEHSGLDLIDLNTPVQAFGNRSQVTPLLFEEDYVPDMAMFEAPGADGRVDDADQEDGGHAGLDSLRLRLF